MCKGEEKKELSVSGDESKKGAPVGGWGGWGGASGGREKPKEEKR